MPQYAKHHKLLHHAAKHHSTAATADTATVAADSARLGSDTTAAAPPFTAHYLGGFPDSTGTDTTVTPMYSLPTVVQPTDGAARSYNNSPLHDTGSMALLLAAMFFIAIAYHSGYKYLENFAHNIFSVKRRENLFDDHTVNDTAIMTALVANTCIMEGLLLFYGITAYVPHLAPLMHSRVWLYVLVLSGAAAVFYVAQLLGYHLLGYVFGDRTSTRLWVSGFNATQSLLGLALLPAVVVTMVWPGAMLTTLTVAMALYVAARIVFISKGFRIFFNDFRASLYFILYLCSVEIVPPIVMLSGTIIMCEILQS